MIMSRYEGDDHDDQETVKASPCTKKVQRGLAEQERGIDSNRPIRAADYTPIKGEEGETALIHKNTGRKPAHALTDETKTIFF